MGTSKLIFAASLAALTSLAGPALAQGGADPSNDARTQGRIAVGATLEGALEAEGDADWYRVRLRANQGYAVTLANGGGDGGLEDPMVRVLDAAGAEIGTNDDGPDGYNSLLVFMAPQAGEYFIEARGFSDTATGAYRLSIAERDLPPDEAGATAATAGRMTLGRAFTGVLAPAGDKDWLRVDLVGGEAYRFTLTKDAAAQEGLEDPHLRIFNAQGEEIAANDDSGDGLNSFLEFAAPTSGRYFIEAASFNESAGGAYTLSGAAGDIPGDASTDLSLTASGGYRNGTLAPAGDSDWFRVDLKQDQTLRLSLAGDGANALSDPMLAVHNSEGQEIASDDDSGEGLNAWLEFNAPETGVYFIAARGFGEGASGGYLLNVMAGEVRGDAQSEETIPVGDEGRVSRISAGGDSDWFAIDLSEGRPYRFSVTGDGNDALVDPVLTLMDNEGNAIASDDDGGAGLSAYLAITPTKGGYHFVAVSSADEAGAGAYRVSVSDTETPGNAQSTEALDAANDDGDAREGAIEVPGDADAYGVDLESGVTYVITIAGAGEYPLKDPMLTMLDGSETDIGSDDNSGPGRGARLEFMPTEASRYFIKVSGARGSTGRYSVSIAKK